MGLRDGVHLRIVGGHDHPLDMRRGLGEPDGPHQQAVAFKLQQVLARDALRAAPHGDDRGHLSVPDHARALNRSASSRWRVRRWRGPRRCFGPRRRHHRSGRSGGLRRPAGVDRLADRGAVIADVDDVAAAVAAVLPGADIDRRNAQIGAFADRHAGVADNAAGVDQDGEKVERPEVLVEVHLAQGKFSRKARMPLDVPSEPASTLGQNHRVGYWPSRTAVRVSTRGRGPACTRWSPDAEAPRYSHRICPRPRRRRHSPTEPASRRAVRCRGQAAPGRSTGSR